jgi:hypothetical protein
MRKRLVSLALVVVGVLVITAPASAATITPKGAGQVHLGATAASLKDKGLIKALKPGCELDPGQKIAQLRAPLAGFVVFSHPNNRASSITITGGARTAADIGIGSTPKQAQQAYPKADYDKPGTLPPFDAGFVWLNNSRDPKMTFIVDPNVSRITSIAVPAPAFCE